MAITLLLRLFIYFFFVRCNLYGLSLIFRNWKIFNQLTLELFHAFFVIIVCCVYRLLFFLTMAETVNSLGKSGRCTDLELAHSSQLDARALRARKRDLYSDVEVFSVRLRAPDQNGNENIHETYHTISENILQLAQRVQTNISGDESIIMSEGLHMMTDTLTRTYNQWLASQDMTSHNLPEILPHDSVSNVGSGTTRSSLTHSQLFRKQIELELKRKELELEKREAVLTAEEKRLTLQIKERLLRSSILPSHIMS